MMGGGSTGKDLPHTSLVPESALSADARISDILDNHKFHCVPQGMCQAIWIGPKFGDPGHLDSTQTHRQRFIDLLLQRKNCW